MKLHVILILLGYINTIIGRCEDKMTFTIIGVGFLVSAIIVWIASL